MSEIISTVVVAIHPSLDVEGCIRAFASTFVQNDQRNFPNLTEEQHAVAATVAYQEGDDNIVYIPFDAAVIAGCVERNVPVTMIRPSVEYHETLTGVTDIAYEVGFRKFAELAVTHDVVIEHDGQTPMLLLHNVFNFDHFGF